MSPERKLARRISKMASIVAILAFVLAVVPAGSAYILRAAGVRTMFVVSQSMVPTFSKGDVILVSSNYGSLTAGDMIAYRGDWMGGKTITHRISRIEDDDDNTVSDSLPDDNAKIFTKGDNNSVEDPGFRTRDDVVGEIVAVFPHAGVIVNTKILIVLACVFVIFVFLSEKDWESYLLKRRQRSSLRAKKVSGARRGARTGRGESEHE